MWNHHKNVRCEDRRETRLQERGEHLHTDGWSCKWKKWPNNSNACALNRKQEYFCKRKPRKKSRVEEVQQNPCDSNFLFRLSSPLSLSLSRNLLQSQQILWPMDQKGKRTDDFFLSKWSSKRVLTFVVNAILDAFVGFFFGDKHLVPFQSVFTALHIASLRSREDEELCLEFSGDFSWMNSSLKERNRSTSLILSLFFLIPVLSAHHHDLRTGQTYWTVENQDEVHHLTKVSIVMISVLIFSRKEKEGREKRDVWQQNTVETLQESNDSRFTKWLYTSHELRRSLNHAPSGVLFRWRNRVICLCFLILEIVTISVLWFCVKEQNERLQTKSLSLKRRTRCLDHS